MSTRADLFPGARVTTHQVAPGVRARSIEPRAGTVIGPEGGDIRCKCGCSGYWITEWDLLEAPHNRMSFLAHDLTLMGAVDQLAARVEPGHDVVEEG